MLPQRLFSVFSPSICPRACNGVVFKVDQRCIGSHVSSTTSILSAVFACFAEWERCRRRAVNMAARVSKSCTPQREIIASVKLFCQKAFHHHLHKK